MRGARSRVLGGDAVVPHVRRLEDVVVDRDQPIEVQHDAPFDDGEPVTGSVDNIPAPVLKQCYLTPMFEGIKIVELAQWVFVPAAGAVFSNLGAEVVKIERLGGGDPLRGLFTASLGQQSGQYNPRVEQNNSGKKSLAIDIGTAEGLEILFRLIEQADVFLTNFRSSTLTRYGLDVDGVRARNPQRHLPARARFRCARQARQPPGVRRIRLLGARRRRRHAHHCRRDRPRRDATRVR